MKHKESGKHIGPEEKTRQAAKALRKFLLGVWNRPYKWTAILNPRTPAAGKKRGHDDEK